VLISFTLTRRKPSVGIHLLHEQNPPRVSSPPNAWIITSSSLHGHIFLSQPRSTRTPSSSHGRPPASTTPTTVEGHDLAGFPDRQSQRWRSQRYQERRLPPLHYQHLILLLARDRCSSFAPSLLRRGSNGLRFVLSDHRDRGRRRSIIAVNWNTTGYTISALSFLTSKRPNPSTSLHTTRSDAVKLQLAGGAAAGDDFISFSLLCFGWMRVTGEGETWMFGTGIGVWVLCYFGFLCGYKMKMRKNKN